MDPNEAIELVRNAVLQATLIGSPLLLVGMVVGLIVSLLQALTQIQDQTLSFVPKIVAMGLAAAFFIPWLTTRMVEYTQRLWGEGMWSP